MTVFPKISIITISYNAEKYIERTIKSVIQQTYPNVEYIIVDGASTDGTIKIIQQYSDQISQWKSEKDKSLYDAMNKGLDRATGEYVLFMNAGDQINDADSLSKMMKGFANADLIYSRAVYLDEAGNRKPWHKKTPTPTELTARSFLNGMVICHQCMIVRRSIAPHYELGKWKVANDIEWSIRVMKNVKTVHYWDDIFSLFLAGGYSAENRLNAVKERFKISLIHFGWMPTIIQQFRILFQLMQNKINMHS